MTRPDMTCGPTACVPGRPALARQGSVAAERVGPSDGIPADVPGGLEDLRARARERDESLELLRRTRADFENYQNRVRREREGERREQYGRRTQDLPPVLVAAFIALMVHRMTLNSS